MVKILKYTDAQWAERSNLEKFNADDTFHFDYYYWDLVDDKDFKERTNIHIVRKENILGGMMLSLHHKDRKNTYWRIYFEKHTKLFAERFYVGAERMSKKGIPRIRYGWLDQLDKKFTFNIRKLSEAINLYDNDDEVLKTDVKIKIIKHSGFGQ